ncbi:unnamed protein product [Leuciscus chuanchicus]
MCPTSDSTSQLLEEIDMDEQVEEDEGFIDLFHQCSVSRLLPLHCCPVSRLHQCPVSRLLPLHRCPVSRLHQCPDSYTTAQHSGSASCTSALFPGSTSTPGCPVSISCTSALSNVIFFQAVDGHCIPGMDRVDELVECLVELRTQASLTLTNQQVATIKTEPQMDYAARFTAVSHENTNFLSFTGIFRIGANYHYPVDLPDTSGLNYKEAIIRCLESVWSRSKTQPDPEPTSTPTTDRGEVT